MASVSQTIRVEGLRELKEAIEEELPKATGKNVIRRALLAAAEPIESTAQALAPVKTGTLRDRITVSTKLSSHQRKGYQKESQFEAYVGPPPLLQAITSEFGTVNQQPIPFMRPAWSANKTKALDLFKKTLEEELEKARARIARKLARLSK